MRRSAGAADELSGKRCSSAAFTCSVQQLELKHLLCFRVRGSGGPHATAGEAAAA